MSILFWSVGDVSDDHNTQVCIASPSALASEALMENQATVHYRQW